ncbi:MAG TPA: tRNA (adenosine(37)-N6)-dimethylallyltransferase MiaA [Petrimonas sp.]|uniref:tRNA (adenosine(37)-N6)-dimethylallyltransferase MiaA n=1 Tax=Petrimonas sp. TaxID=2023866 RepID=UPI000968BF05|nr:tRNA (adenosine(37)-N6)-dimethylallyltransferase MiaA [Petrimonas sp.]OJV35677.1 MAG: tRNA (adenosine(37)-N6)-dimethylallyltransferase MiaA [Bacteroidia bacterium 43-41]MEA4979084.1 tRNA (adenosine(37)-N6)-dimethylallyltransferase MiaA [Petrimonas sp.]MEA5046764.1 tRNA (adenosine(37)-N6)-dimethylallyltransferase MiaA [Petrimonas sp.]MEA5063222.1 tRNA (adenosine(37)-N6)-dimethylallyltransferase MiaA [Petrimonas sp.]
MHNSQPVSRTPKLVTVLGPTASGKTTFAAHLASRLDGEIISADSRQVYRGMDIGTGKDLADYTVDGKPVPYHLIDIRDAGDKYTLFNYQHDFHKVYNDILLRHKTPILCGGTGLYIESILKGYRLPDVPENIDLRKRLESKSLDELTRILSSYKPLHNTTDTDTRKRAIRAIEIADFQSRHPASELDYPPVDSVIIGIDIDRESRRQKISSRLKKRLDEGMVDEIRALLDKGVSSGDLIYYGLEYKFVTLYVTGKINFEEMSSQLEIAIHQFAKRQMTWFRGMEKRGFTIHWLDFSLSVSEKIDKALVVIRNF